jgi:xylulokinase
MSRIIGIDIGTTACKAVLIDEYCRILAEHSIEYPLLSPRPGWTEQNPDDWVAAANVCIRALGNFDALGFTGQMHGSVFLDDRDRVIRPALLWNDQRTVAEVQEMESVLGIETILAATCNPPLSGFQAPKILWLRNNEPDNFKRVASVLLPKDYVRFKLTGNKATDCSDASGTGLFDVPNRRWASAIIERLGLDPRLFPPSVESYELPGAGDQAAGAVGVGSITKEIANVSLGTSGVVFATQDDASFDATGRAHTFCHANGKWHSMGVMLSCGGAIRWARDVFHFDGFDEMASLAQEAKASEVRFYPYLAGERTPHNDPSLRGSFEGLALADGRAEIARAVFEGITFGLVDCFHVVSDLRKQPIESIRATGGGSKSDFWLQLLADTLEIPICKVSTDAGPALGAAILAGIEAGGWASLEEATSNIKPIKAFEPEKRRSELLLARYHTWSCGRSNME